jgi:predicted NUDIX family NTP pyrophosphohydrolase
MASSAAELQLDPLEITRAEFFIIECARERLHEAQTVFLDRLLIQDCT